MVSPLKQAVFLSHASEDSAAALRICEALRAAGIEVWFDQSELRGGDAWDRQIRKQLHDCALFVAVISTNTNARTEGYFRREWRLAVERTKDMADDAPFLLPVAVDDTNEASARVPEQFREVHWTRLPDGAVSAEFIAQVHRLLSLEPAVTAASMSRTPAESGPIAARTSLQGETGNRSTKWQTRGALLLVAAAIIATGYFVVDRLMLSGHRPKPGSTALSAQPPGGDTRSVANEKSIAVLPFVNLSSDKEQEYFSDGLSEELINLLAKIPELHVSARTSSFYFKGKQAMIADVARALGVANVLEGSVRKSGKTLRVTAQLVRADNGYPIWSDTYERPLDDIFKIQDDIAASVINGLKLSLLGAQQPHASRTANTEAYNLFLQAQSLQYFGATSADLERVAEYLKQALKLDPAFAPAWAALANNLVAEYSLYGTLQLEATRDDAHEAAQRALDLDPNLPLAHVAMGRLLLQVDWKWDAAKAELDKAIALEPGSAEPYRLAGYLATTRGRFDEARGLFQRAVSADPLQPWNYIATGYVDYRTGDLPRAEAMYKRALELAPGLGKLHYVLGSLFLARGEAPAALIEMHRETNSGFRQCGLVLALDALGRKSEADPALAAAVRTYAGQKAYLIALIYARRHQPDHAFAWLDRAVAQHDGDLVYIKGDPMVSDLVTDSRYKLLMQRMQIAD
jgi:TolB-like protein/Flp pilus assembly protein TadD